MLRLLALPAAVWTVGCGGDAVARYDPGPSSVADARVDRADARNHESPGERPSSIDASVPAEHSNSTISVDASAITLTDANDGARAADAAPASCTTTPARDVDAGTCLGIYYATVAQLVLWVEDRSAADGGSRVTLAKGDPIRVGGHSYSYSGNSLITSGSGVEVHLDVDGVRDSLSFELQGCAPKTGSRTWDYPATLIRTTCPTCTPTRIGRHYSVVETRTDGGMVYVFNADEPARSCGAGVDLLSFTTWPL
jgi:hypothetical protein